MSSKTTTYANILGITHTEARQLVDHDCILIAVPRAWAQDLAAATDEKPHHITVHTHHPLHAACTQALAHQ